MWGLCVFGLNKKLTIPEPRMTCQAPTLLEKITTFVNDGFQKPITTFVNDGLQKPNNFSMMGCKNQ